MKKTIKFLFFAVALGMLPTLPVVAQDELYMTVKEAEDEIDSVKAAEQAEYEARQARIQARQVELRRQEMAQATLDSLDMARENDTIYVDDDMDYVYTRRLNKYHDAGIVVYEVNTVDPYWTYPYYEYGYYSPYYSFYYGYRPYYYYGWNSPYWGYGYYNWHHPLPHHYGYRPVSRRDYRSHTAYRPYFNSRRSGTIRGTRTGQRSASRSASRASAAPAYGSGSSNRNRVVINRSNNANRSSSSTRGVRSSERGASSSRSSYSGGNTFGGSNSSSSRGSSFSSGGTRQSGVSRGTESSRGNRSGGGSRGGHR